MSAELHTGTEAVRIDFTGPASVAGTKVLATPGGTYVYLPAVRRLRKVPKRQRAASLLGTTLSYALFDRRLHERFTWSTKTAGGTTILEGAATNPKNTEHATAKIVLGSAVPKSVQFLDRSGAATLTVDLSGTVDVAGTTIPKTAVFTSKKGRTTVHAESARSERLPRSEFTRRALR